MLSRSWRSIKTQLFKSPQGREKQVLRRRSKEKEGKSDRFGMYIIFIQSMRRSAPTRMNPAKLSKYNLIS
jgi:hypothetical protein